MPSSCVLHSFAIANASARIWFTYQSNAVRVAHRVASTFDYVYDLVVHFFSLLEFVCRRLCLRFGFYEGMLLE